MVTLSLLPDYLTEHLGLDLPVPVQRRAGGRAGHDAGGNRGASRRSISPPACWSGCVLGWFFIRPVNFVLGGLFRGFNWGFDQMTGVYGWTVGRGLRLALIVLVLYGGLLVADVHSVSCRSADRLRAAAGHGPAFVSLQLPDSASLERTQKIMAQVDEIAARDARHRP